MRTATARGDQRGIQQVFSQDILSTDAPYRCTACRRRTLREIWSIILAIRLPSKPQMPWQSRTHLVGMGQWSWLKLERLHTLPRYDAVLFAEHAWCACVWSSDCPKQCKNASAVVARQCDMNPYLLCALKHASNSTTSMHRIM